MEPYQHSNEYNKNLFCEFEYAFGIFRLERLELKLLTTTKIYVICKLYRSVLLALDFKRCYFVKGV